MSTRERILEAAAVEFAEQGYAGARVAAIAQRSGANVERLYYYFGDKRGLFAAVMGDVMAQIVDAEPFDADDLPAYIAAMAAFHHSQPGLIKLLLGEGRAGERLPDKSARRAHYRARTAAIREAQAAGRLREDVDARLVVYAVLALVVTVEALPQISELILGRMSEKRFRTELARLAHALFSPGA